MSEVKTFYNVNNLTIQEINLILHQIADRLDKLEGRRGSPEFFANINMRSNKITSATQGTVSGEVLTADMADDSLEVSSDGLKVVIKDDGGIISSGSGLEIDPSNIDHGELAGLADDDHTQYLLLAGRAGGQTANGGTASGEDLKLISTAHATKGSVYIGGDGGTTNYSEFESDGTLRLVGAATVYDDLPPMPIVTARLGSSAPTLATFLGNIEQYTFDATNDYVIGATEITHKYKEGTNLLGHIHWVTNGSDVGDTGVKWQLEMGVANADSTAPFAYSFTGSTVTTSIDVTIPGGTATLSHIVSDFTDAITGTSLKIGAYVVWRLSRIASATAAPAANPFALAVGFHCEMDTIGSRAMYVK